MNKFWTDTIKGAAGWAWTTLLLPPLTYYIASVKQQPVLTKIVLTLLVLIVALLIIDILIRLKAYRTERMVLVESDASDSNWYSYSQADGFTFPDGFVQFNITAIAPVTVTRVLFRAKGLHKIKIGKRLIVLPYPRSLTVKGKIYRVGKDEKGRDKWDKSKEFREFDHGTFRVVTSFELPNWEWAFSTKDKVVKGEVCLVDQYNTKHWLKDVHFRHYNDGDY